MVEGGAGLEGGYLGDDKAEVGLLDPGLGNDPAEDLGFFQSTLLHYILKNAVIPDEWPEETLDEHFEVGSVDAPRPPQLL